MRTMRQQISDDRLPPEWKRTRTGRIVYKRKLRPFTVRDVERIMNYVTLPNAFNWGDVLSRVLQLIVNIVMQRVRIVISWEGMNPRMLQLLHQLKADLDDILKAFPQK